MKTATITFVAIGDQDATPAFKALLKRALRDHGLRCVRIQEITDHPDPPPAVPTAPPNH